MSRRDDEDIRLMRRLHKLTGSTWLMSVDEEGLWLIGLEAGGPSEILAEFGRKGDSRRYAAAVEPDDVRILARHHELVGAMRKAVAVLEKERNDV